MPQLILLAALASTPVMLRIDMQDALRLPSGVETPPGKPLVIYLRAPPTWVKANGLTDAGKTAVLARLYGGPNWMKGNSDGSTYVVKSFAASLIPAGARVPIAEGAFWYEVLPDGSLDKRGVGFTAAPAPAQPQSLIGSAEKGSIFKRGPKLDEGKKFFATHKGTVKLAVTLKRGQVGFDKKGAKAGPLELSLDDAALGVSLDDRARQACAEAATCELWLVGDFQKATFAVKQVAGTPSGFERQEGHTQVIWLQEG
ncbi:MAG: hypothetical protein JNK82_25740 [Myxococcaceae bacterium]|nr:hypothetical protein [Myxococcaceae bacterium]